MNLNLNHEDLNILLTAACRAPSGGNIQPWLVEHHTNFLKIKLNPEKFGTVLDINQYGSLYSLGAFTYNLEVAADSLGLTYEKVMLETNDSIKFNVNFTFTKRGQRQEHPLYQAMLARETNRRLHEGKIISESEFQMLPNLVNTLNPDFRLDTVFDNDGKKEMASILGKADLIRTKNYTLLQQMMSEIRWNPKDAIKTKDGMDIRTMELPGNVSKMLQLLSKFASLAKTVPDIALEKQAWPLLKNSSHIAVLSFKNDPNPLNFFNTGYIMQRVWVEATQKGWAVHPWTVLSFFIIRAKYAPGSFFSSTEESLLMKMDRRLRKLIKLPSLYTPAFIFRLSRAKPASTRSLRYDWTQITKKV